ncbi:MAG: isochorismate synthase MenF [Acidimicrobiales bacterium]
MKLRARSWRLDQAPDLLSVTGQYGQLFSVGSYGYAGRGEALRIRLPAPWVENVDTVTRSLTAIEVQGDHAPVAFGALPFDRSVAASVVVPRLLVRSDVAGTHWAMTVGDEEHPDAAYPPRAEPAEEAATTITFSAEITPEDWCEQVATATDHIRAGELQKVVLSRVVECESDVNLDQRLPLANLQSQFPSSMVFAVDQFIGATPELLVAVHADAVQSQPMAGTTPFTGNARIDAQAAAALLASKKDLEEHQYTIDMVHDTLLEWCSYLDSGAAPEIHAVANVQHLASKVVGRLSVPYASALEIVAGLHPTPAVGGLPRAIALALMAELEPSKRGRYAGPVGWINADGDGEFGVGIRSAQIDGRRGVMHSGVGVVADSDPEAELAETRAKFRTMFGAFNRL